MKCVFLDRDGTINVDHGYVHKINDFELIPKTIDALKILQQEGYALIIITDQSGIGRGHYTLEDYRKVTEHFERLLKKENVFLTAVYMCPHSPDEKCKCRKPSPFFARKAKEEHNIDLSRSFFVGDKTKDIETGKRSGTKTILVQTGKGGKDKEYNAKPDYVAKDLYEAALWIVENDRKNQDKGRNKQNS